MSYSGADGGDMANAFMPGHERELRLHRPVAARGMKIRMADARRDELDDDLPRSGLRHR